MIFLLLKASFLRLQNINLIYQNHSGDNVKSQVQAIATSIKIVSAYISVVSSLLSLVKQ